MTISADRDPRWSEDLQALIFGIHVAWWKAGVSRLDMEDYLRQRAKPKPPATEEIRDKR